MLFDIQVVGKLQSRLDCICQLLKLWETVEWILTLPNTNYADIAFD